MVSVLSLGLLVHPTYSTPVKPSIEITQRTPSINREVRNFFETGRLTPEDRLLFRNPPTGVIPLRNQSDSWQFFVFKRGGVSLWMPPGIITQDEVLLETSLGDIRFQSLASHTENQYYIAAYAEELTEDQIENIDLLLEVIQEKILPEENFKLTRERAILLDDNIGKELTFENENDIITLRIYLVKNRVYVLGVRFPNSITDTRSSRTFLNGLELL